MVSQSLIIERIFRAQYGQSVNRVDELIVDGAMQIGLETAQAEEYAYRNRTRIWSRIVKRIDEEELKGLSATFEIVDRARYDLRWYPYINPGDPRTLTFFKKRLSRRGDLLDFIDSLEVDSRDYEALGCIISKYSGAKRWHLTPRGNDAGIDFMAAIPSTSRSHLFPHPNKNIKVIGQSKKWDQPIPKSEVKKLSYTLNDIRHNSSDLTDIIPAWFIASRGALIGCIISHSGVQAGAQTIADQHGIILADSRDVAEILITKAKWASSRNGDINRNTRAEILSVLTE